MVDNKFMEEMNQLSAEYKGKEAIRQADFNQKHHNPLPKFS